ncbi:MAG TPA: hypothetical protein PL183_00895, partial [Aquamicrobium sp.]|nr:hypothetical protein [Aquamicrobium sp.]
GGLERGIVIAPAATARGTSWQKPGKGAKPAKKKAHRGKAAPADHGPARKHKGKVQGSGKGKGKPKRPDGL